MANLDERSKIRSGFFWLGTASGLSKIIDFLEIVIILIFISREELGVATLAWTVAVFLEAFNGLGVGTAILQREEVPKSHLDGLFWFTMGLAILMVLTVTVASPWIASAYGSPSLAPMIIVSSAKLLPLAGALIPLQILNRQLKFREIGAIRTLATLLASLFRIGLVMGGHGAWALVIAHGLHGVFIFIGASIVAPFRPSLVFRFTECWPYISFGGRVAISGIIYHFYRNMDYLLVGRFLGKEALGVYRVAFDVAMKLSEEVLVVVGRAAFPIFARLSREGDRLVATFNWTSRNLALILMPVAIIIYFCAPPLLAIEGKWLMAAPQVQILCWAGLLRCLALLFPQLFHAVGKPQYAIYDALISFCVLLIGFSLALTLFRDQGALGVAMTWIISYPLLLGILIFFARRSAPFRALTYLKELLPAFAGGGLLVLALTLIRAFLPQNMNPLLEAAVLGGLSLLMYLAYLKYGLGLSFKSLKGDPEEDSQGPARKDQVHAQ